MLRRALYLTVRPQYVNCLGYLALASLSRAGHVLVDAIRLNTKPFTQPTSPNLNLRPARAPGEAELLLEIRVCN